jgi:hypothetical protein
MTETIALIGREYSKEMRLLVKNQAENEPKEPVMPNKEEAKSPFVMKKYETELKQYYFKKERCEEHKVLEAPRMDPPSWPDGEPQNEMSLFTSHGKGGSFDYNQECTEHSFTGVNSKSAWRAARCTEHAFTEPQDCNQSCIGVHRSAMALTMYHADHTRSDGD